MQLTTAIIKSKQTDLKGPHDSDIRVKFYSEETGESIEVFIQDGVLKVRGISSLSVSAEASNVFRITMPDAENPTT